MKKIRQFTTIGILLGVVSIIFNLNNINSFISQSDYTLNSNPEVALEATSNSNETASPVVFESKRTFTESNVTTVLVADQPYRTRARANCKPNSSQHSIYLAKVSQNRSIDNIANPNPINSSNGKHLNFPPLPNSSVEFTIHTTTDEIVLHKIILLTSPHWNKSSAVNHTISSGTYLRYLKIDNNNYFESIINI